MGAVPLSRTRGLRATLLTLMWSSFYLSIGAMLPLASPPFSTGSGGPADEPVVGGGELRSDHAWLWRRMFRERGGDDLVLRRGGGIVRGQDGERMSVGVPRSLMRSPRGGGLEGLDGEMTGQGRERRTGDRGGDWLEGGRCRGGGDDAGAATAADAPVASDVPQAKAEGGEEEVGGIADAGGGAVDGGERIMGQEGGPSEGQQGQGIKEERNVVLPNALWRSTERCWVCGEKAEQQCAMCTRAKYCGRECQR